MSFQQQRRPMRSRFMPTRRILLTAQHGDFPEDDCSPGCGPEALSDDDPSVRALSALLVWLGVPAVYRGRRMWIAVLPLVLLGGLAAGCRWYAEFRGLTPDGNVSEAAQVNYQFRAALYAVALAYLLRQAFRRTSVQDLALTLGPEHLTRGGRVMASRLLGSVAGEVALLVVPAAAAQAAIMAYFYGYRGLLALPGLLDGIPWPARGVGATAFALLVWAGATYAQAVFMLPCVLFRVACAQALHRVACLRQTYLMAEDADDPLALVTLASRIPKRRASEADHAECLGPSPVDCEPVHEPVCEDPTDDVPKHVPPVVPRPDLRRTLAAFTDVRAVMRRLSHRYRFLLVAYAVLVTVEACHCIYYVAHNAIVEETHRESILASSEQLALSSLLLLSSAFHIAGFWLMIRAATIISHRIKDSVQDFARLHAMAACGVASTGQGAPPDPGSLPSMAELREAGQGGAHADGAGEPGSGAPWGGAKAGEGSVRGDPQCGGATAAEDRDPPEEFRKRQAILTYMTDSLPGVTVFGFRLDREALFRSQTIVVSAIAFITTRILAAYQAAIHS